VRVLGIETSGSFGGFAIADDSGVLAEVAADIMGHHLERGSDMIREVMAEAGLALRDLAGVAVSLGPGSFTGLRVGLALAKGMCLGSALQLVGVPTLDCVALGLASFGGLVVPVRDARRGEVYFAVYEVREGRALRLSPYRALAPEAVVEELREGSWAGSPPGGLQRVALAGTGLARYGDIFRSGLGERAVIAPEALWEARPGVVAAEGLKLLGEGKVASLDTLEPIYVRASEAERQAAGRVPHGTGRDPKNERS
jgi:tRNA threonylcarbamoyladenosine biosynthesis protein TsaB